MRHAIVRAASAAVIAIVLATATGFAAQTGQLTITKAVYKESKGILVIAGSGFDNTATVRINGVELTGEKKFNAQKGRLKVPVPAGFAFKAAGENRVEIVQNEASSGEFPF
jgi:hypothetical protein